MREEFDIYKFYYLNHGELYQVKVANTVTIAYNYDNEFKLLSETYANDEVIRYTYNDNGNVTAQYHNSNANPYVTYTYNADGELTQKINTDTGLKYIYGENGSVSVYKTADNTLVNSYTATETEADEANNITAKTDIAETHFGQSFTSVVRDKSIDYTFNGNTAGYSYQTEGTDESEKMTADTVNYNGNTVLSSAYTYDDKDNITNKLYTFKIDGEDRTVDIKNQYDSEGRITDTGYNGYDIHYTYDSNGQLIRVDNAPASHTATVYSYDSRGNVIEKRVHPFTYTEEITSEPTETKTFTYANSGWKDLLIAVDGVELTYDEIGNVLTFGNRTFTWNSGRNLASITDGNNTYSYKYDENGIRTSKTVNGVTTYYNTKDGVILSQSNGTDTMYFQYDTSGTPLGFIFNGVQYFYMTNQMGDVIAIIDANDAPVCEYIYDEWGNILDIAYVDETNAQQIAVANANPLRYRGYYYDTETGYYYLQSRYYDPSICRFINADIPEIASISTGESVGENLFSYCNNEPINSSDPTGYKRYSGFIGFGFQFIATANVFMHQGFIGAEFIWFTKENNFGRGTKPWGYWFVGGSMGTTLDFNKLLSTQLFTNPKNVLKGFGFTFSVNVSISIFVITGNKFSNPTDYLRWFTFKNVTIAGVTISKAWSNQATTYGVGVSWSIGVKKWTFSCGKLWYGFSAGGSYYRPIRGIWKNTTALYNYVSVRKPR